MVGEGECRESYLVDGWKMAMKGPGIENVAGEEGQRGNLKDITVPLGDLLQFDCWVNRLNFSLVFNNIIPDILQPHPAHCVSESNTS